MIVYLASPNTQQQAEHAADMPVLLSFAVIGKKCDWLDKGYQQSFKRILIDSGAYSELTSGVKVDVAAYAEWVKQWDGHCDAWAGLDDISGDWRRSLANYEHGGFPTFHDTDPPELLDDLIEIAKERGRWIGLGIKPPRDGKEKWVRDACDRIPDNFHVHGWALRAYTKVRRLDSVDSNNWWMDAQAMRKQLPWLNYGECLAIVVKRYQRWNRTIKERDDVCQPKLFA